MMTNKKLSGKKIYADPTTEDFGSILVCAVRYALGRQTYMPSIVVGYVIEMIHELEPRSLKVIQKDVYSYLSSDPECYGDILYDWRRLVKAIDAEREERANQLGSEC